MNINEIIVEEYNKYRLDINNIESIFNKLGEGGFGKVFEKNGLAYKITEDKSEAIFSVKIKQKQDQISTFPIIHEIYQNPKIKGLRKKNDYYIIVREIVEPIKLSPTLKARFSNNVFKIQNYINFGEELILQYLIDFSKLPQEYIDFIINLRKDNLTLDKKYNGIDFHSGNIGINKSGNLVLFDY